MPTIMLTAILDVVGAHNCYINQLLRLFLYMIRIDGYQRENVVNSLFNLRGWYSIMKKICKKHGELTEDQIRRYTRNRRGRSELTFQCKLCHRETASQARNLDRTKANEWAREDRKNYPEKYAAQRKRRRLLKGSKIVQNEMLRRFKITLEQYEKMCEEQCNLCAICGKPETRKSRSKIILARLSIDHCHKKSIDGKVHIRGLLCARCNLMIGYADDEIEKLQSAIEYLKKH
jgi:hypothetical protein